MRVRYVEKGYNNVYYFRMAIPLELRKYLKCCNIRRSLKTKNEFEAAARAEQLAIEFQNQFSAIRNKLMPDKKDLFINLTPNKHSNSILETLEQQIKIARLNVTLSNGAKVELENLETDPDSEKDARIVELLLQGQVKNEEEKNAIDYSDESIYPKAKSGQTISETINDFVESKRNDGASERYIEQLIESIQTLIFCIGDLKVDTLRKEHIDKFIYRYQRMPPNRNKNPEFKNKTAEEIIQIEIPEKDRITVSTFNNNIQKLSTYAIWLKRNGYINLDNPFSGKKKKKKKSTRDEWNAFSRKEVQTIFSKDNFEFSKEHPSRFWVPLILAHIGARVEEICGLYKSDIRKDADTELWYIDIRKNNEDKHIKNFQSERLVPIPQKLIEFGFLNYVVDQRGILTPFR